LKDLRRRQRKKSERIGNHGASKNKKKDSKGASGIFFLLTEQSRGRGGKRGKVGVHCIPDL